MKRTVVPIDLGGSPHRSSTDPAPTAAPGPELVAAMVAHYTTERIPPAGGPVEVGFFRGGLPDDALLAVCAPHPVRVACRPADLRRQDADRLRAGGVQTIELDLGTFQRSVLRGIGRRTRPEVLPQMCAALASQGFRVGVHLSPGLPGSSHLEAVEDAQRLVALGHVHFVRLLPQLVFADTHLAELHRSGRYAPMGVAAAVSTCVAMADVLTQGGIEIARIGGQPGPDQLGQLLAGPWHPNLRQLVESRRYLGRLRTLLASFPRGVDAVVEVNPRDLAWAKGPESCNVRSLRADRGLRSLTVRTHEAVSRGAVRLPPETELAQTGHSSCDAPGLATADV